MVLKQHTVGDRPALLVYDQSPFDQDTNTQPLSQCQIEVMSTHQLQTANFSKRYALGGMLLIGTQDDESTLHAITRLRDVFAQHCLLMASAHSPYRTQLSGLGFSRLNLQKSDGMNPNNFLNFERWWQFNLYDYKIKPDWLNAKYWANPELFDRFRW